MTGLELIAEERQRQVLQEGWTRDHDAAHASSEMALMAAHYILLSARDDTQYYTIRRDEPSDLTRLMDLAIPFLVPEGWHSKPKRKLRNLVRAGALIAAEIDRLQRAEREQRRVR